MLKGVDQAVWMMGIVAIVGIMVYIGWTILSPLPDEGNAQSCTIDLTSCCLNYCIYGTADTCSVSSDLDASGEMSIGELASCAGNPNAGSNNPDLICPSC